MLPEQEHSAARVKETDSLTGSFDETLEFDSLFEEAQDTPPLFATGEADFCDLFDAPKESEESLDLLEVSTSASSTQDADLSAFWDEEPEAQAQIEFEDELVFSADAGENLFDELPATETFTHELPDPEATAATDVDVQIDDSLSDFFGEFSSTTESEDVDILFDLEAQEEVRTPTEVATDLEDFASLDALLTEEAPPAATTSTSAFPEEAYSDEFAQLEALLDLDTPTVMAGTQAAGSPTPDLSIDDDEFGDLDKLLEEAPPVITAASALQEEASFDEFAQLEALLDLDTPTVIPGTQAGGSLTPDLSIDDDEFGDLEKLLEEAPPAITSASTSQQEASSDEFAQLEALLDLDTPTVVPSTQAAALSPAPNSSVDKDEFGDLEKLLEKTDTKAGTKKDASAAVKPNSRQSAATGSRRGAFEQTMRVPVKHLDNVSNMVGELVVYRNSLEQDQERLRQFLDNLLHRVQQLSDVGARMQELYERSLMEASLLNIRGGSRSASVDSSANSSEGHATGMDFDALEMDRFTGFHTLSQEMIELIVRVRESTSDIEFITDETEQVARQFRQVTNQLQEGLTQSRMVPFSQIAERLPRAVRDIALKYGKQAELHIEGQETLIDKMLLEQLYDPMTHLVNNSITHGVETPEERSQKGKSPVGQITVRAFHQGNKTVISVSDDGAGIDTDRVMTKAIQKGLITVAEARAMSRLDAYNLLFHPGFSTKDQADEFAGRGVGMDVVKTSLSEIRGTINTDSTLGKGTTFTIRLPLTLSICKALCCVSDKAQIAIPMDGVEEMMDVPAKNVVSNAEGQSCIPWRDSLLPFRPLKELLKYNRQLSRGNVYGSNREDDMISIVVLRSAGTFIALQVDQVLGEQEIVIKQFEAPAPKPIGVAGATVMGDGRIMPIADVLELIDLSMGRFQQEGGTKLWVSSAAPVEPETPASVKTEPMVLIIDDSITVRELLSMTFNKAGYRVQQARDGQEAWDKLRDGLPCDIVFCDIEMPRMDGLELLSRMQKDPRLSQMPIAMLTSRGADRHRQMAAQLGARGYFTKPYLEEALLDGAQRMLKGEVLLTANSNA